MRINAKGQLTIPIEIRKRLGLLLNTEVEFEVVGNTVRLRKAKNARGRGAGLVAQLRGRARTKLSTEEDPGDDARLTLDLLPQGSH